MAENNRQQRIDAVFQEACELPASEHADFLDQACGDDSEIRAAVERLLAADKEIQADDDVLATQPLKGVFNKVQEAAGDALGEAEEIRSGAADRNLLFGIVALQMNFINRDALITAMNAWVLSKAKPIEKILIAQGDLGDDTNMLLTALVDKHLEHHDNNAEKSLASLSAVGDLKKQLDQIEDDELHRSVVYLDSESVTRNSGETTVDVGDVSKRGGRFRVLRPHRKGGLGIVSIARDEELNREVAFKEVKEEYVHHKGATDRLRVEAEITGGLEHPGIVPVYGLGNNPDGSPFYCMRFIKGDSLKEAIKSYQEIKDSLSASDQNLALRKLLRRFIDVCDSISYAHSRKVLHRDLKPGNIMLGKYGETLVVDWGLAKATAHGEPTSFASEMPIVPRSGSTAAPTVAGSTLGTPQYMSPEQAEGQIDKLGPATDIYSLGATLYCVLTGTSPFTDRDTTEVLRKVRNGDFPPPIEVEKTVPKALNAICLKAMEKVPSQRYSSPDALTADIECWLADEPVSAHPDPMSVKLARTVRKNRTAAIALSAVVVTALIGLIAANAITRTKNTEILAQKTVIENRYVELEVVKKQLEESKDETFNNYKKFRGLTRNFIAKAENELSQQPGAENLRQWLTHQALEFFKSSQENNSTDLDSRIWLAQLYRIDANVDRRANRINDSIAKYDIALPILEEVTIADPSNQLGRDRFSETLRDYANTIKRAGRLKEANQLLDQAISVSQHLQDDFPDELNYKRTHGANLVDAADVEFDLANIDIALNQAISAAELFVPIVDGGNAVNRDEQILIFAIQRQSICLRELKRMQEAGKQIDEAIRRVRLRDQALDQIGNRHTLARTLLEKAKVQNSMGQNLTVTRQTIDEAIKIWEKLKTQSAAAVFEKYLAEANATRAFTYSINDMYAVAKVDYEQALKLARAGIAKSPGDPSYLHVYGNILAEFAELENKYFHNVEARRLFEQAIEQLEFASDTSPNHLRIKNMLVETKSKLNMISD